MQSVPQFQYPILLLDLQKYFQRGLVPFGIILVVMGPLWDQVSGPPTDGDKAIDFSVEV